MNFFFQVRNSHCTKHSIFVYIERKVALVSKKKCEPSNWVELQKRISKWDLKPPLLEEEGPFSNPDGDVVVLLPVRIYTFKISSTVQKCIF